MTLIACPDCGQGVSDLAAACPHCARPIQAGLPSVQIKKVPVTPAGRQRSRARKPPRSWNPRDLSSLRWFVVGTGALLLAILASIALGLLSIAANEALGRPEHYPPVFPVLVLGFPVMALYLLAPVCWVMSVVRLITGSPDNVAAVEKSGERDRDEASKDGE